MALGGRYKALAPSAAPLGIAFAAAMATASALAQGAGDPVAGAEVYKQCAPCHSVGANPPAGKAGPSLNAIIGRKTAMDTAFNYSPQMRSARLIWNEPALARFLKAPKSLIAGTRMLFNGVGSEKDIADVIAFLGQYDENGNRR
jgi:cytochrome c